MPLTPKGNRGQRHDYEECGAADVALYSRDDGGQRSRTNAASAVRQPAFDATARCCLSPRLGAWLLLQRPIAIRTFFWLIAADCQHKHRPV